MERLGPLEPEGASSAQRRALRPGRALLGRVDVRPRGRNGDRLLHRVGRDGTARGERTEIGVSNGLAFAPDGRTMYFADTHRDIVWAYDYDADTGEATNERVFLDFGPLPGRPDGACVDEDGVLLDRLRLRLGGAAGHAGRRGRPADRGAGREADDARVRWPTSRPCSSRRSAAAGRTRRTRPSPTRAASSRSSPASAGCRNRVFEGGPRPVAT